MNLCFFKEKARIKDVTRLFFGMIPRIVCLLLGAIIFCVDLPAQEVLKGLENNPDIIEYFQNNPDDTRKYYAYDYLLELPFKDEFSNTKVYPDDSLWADKNVYINNSYPFEPLSYGVATFDAFNEKGQLYSNASNSVFGADTLTSKHINLDYNASDSIFLSFYHQPMGYGDYPETKDSLCLDFYAKDSVKWYKIKCIQGDTLRPFKIEIIAVTDNMYLKKGFRFRFRSFASLSKNADVQGRRSNVDHWHIDYVYLNAGRSYADTIMHDVAFSESLLSLVNTYRSMPWQHFQEAYLAESKSEMPIVYNNNDNIIRHVYRHFKITDNNNNTVFNPLPKLNEPDPFEQTVEGIPLETLESHFDNNDSATFHVMAFLDQQDPGDFSFYNDTVKHTQYFHNYYAYDDGSAEAGYGLMGQGTENATLAYRFTIKQKDKLQGLFLSFNRSLESEVVYFYPTVWADNNGKPGNIIYQNKESDSINRKGLNRYFLYPFDNAIDIKKNEVIYVGWEQTKNYFMNVGYDVNSQNENKIFYNVAGTWEQSAYNGALMIRPVFGDQLPVPVCDNKQNDVGVNIFPNPAKEYINVVFQPGIQDNINYKIFSSQGQLLQGSRYEPGYSINTSGLADGLYVIVFTGHDIPVIRKKFIVNQ